MEGGKATGRRTQRLKEVVFAWPSPGRTGFDRPRLMRKKEGEGGKVASDTEAPLPTRPANLRGRRMVAAVATAAVAATAAATAAAAATAVVDMVKEEEEGGRGGRRWRLAGAPAGGVKREKGRAKKELGEGENELGACQ